MDEDAKGKYFSYYDNYTQRKGESVGRDVINNKFRLHKQGNTYVLADKDGTSPYNGNVLNSSNPYTITEVRDND